MSEPSSTKSKFTGLYAATLTPYDLAGKVDSGVVREHTAWLIEHGVEGLCPAGTTGEFLFLTQEEKKAVLKATVEGAGGKAPVIAGVWASDPKDAADLALFSERIGADGVFLPTPLYYPVSQAAIYCWYKAISQAVALPVFAYNIPQYAANAITFDTLTRLFEDGIIAGVKDSTGNAERVGELVKRFGERFTVFAASDSFASEGRQLGADGFISAIANAVPGLFARLWNGEETLQGEVDSLRSTLKQYGSIPALKTLLLKHGFAFNGTRIPFSNLTSEEAAELDFKVH